MPDEATEKHLFSDSGHDLWTAVSHSRKERREFGRLVLCLVAMLALLPPSLAETKPAPDSSSVLEGKVKDEGHIQPSVKLLLVPAEKPKPRVEPKVKQFSGTQPYLPGQPAPKLPPPIKLDATKIGVPDPKVIAKPAPPPAWLHYQLTPRNGVMIWNPEYQVKVITSERPYKRRILPTISDRVTRPLLREMKTKPVLVSQPVQLRATPMVMPGLPPVFRAMNWDDWYKHVANAVYEKWSHQSVGPGSACVRITAWRSHGVDCKIVGFTPVSDLERDAAAEAKFREAAIDTVNKFNGDELWEFPPMVNAPKNIVFDMDMSRSVGGPVGCEVVHMHNSDPANPNQH